MTWWRQVTDLLCGYIRVAGADMRACVQGLLRVNDTVLPQLPKRKKKAGPHVNYTTPPIALEAYPGLLKTGKNTLTVSSYTLHTP